MKPRKRGRPRIRKGERAPCGKLRPRVEEPNEEVVKRRKGLCVDITMATTPLDCAFSNGWLTVGRYAAGCYYARLCRLAGFGPARTTASADLETPGREADRRSFSEMKHSEIAAVFDAVFDVRGLGHDERERRTAEALDAWKRLNARLAPDVKRELYGVAVDQSFPMWVIFMANDRELKAGGAWEKSRDRLMVGLKVVAEFMRAEKARKAMSGGAPASAAFAKIERPSGPMSRADRFEQLVAYVDENDEFDPLLNRAGEAVEVVKLKRRRDLAAGEAGQ